jgi:hypothetical protein
MKLMLCSRRHPDMDRAQFFNHLANVHGPLVKSLPECTRYIRKYVQNQTRLPADGIHAATAFRHEQERDSVIELWFDDKQGLLQSLGESKYQTIVRPDEARFNDLSQLLILAAREVPYKPAAGTSAICKSFDFIKRREDLSHDAFEAHWARHADLLLAQGGYQQYVQQASRNVVLSQEENPFGASAPYDGVVETWFASFDDAQRWIAWRNDSRTVLESEAQFIDAVRSFSVLAEATPVIG